LRQSDALFLVPAHGILDIGLGEWPNYEPARPYRSVAVVEFLAEAILDSLPVIAGVGIGFEIPQPLVDDFSMPVRYRNRLGRRRDSVPQRLQVVDLFVDRQVIESRRGKRDRSGHEC
jgi:hypothetical protein